VPIRLPESRYDTSAKLDAFYEALVSRVRGLPGVSAASFTGPLPLTGIGYTSDFVIASHPRGEYGSEVAHRRVWTEYFRTMRVPILKGRDFTPADAANAQPVVIINQALAEGHFKGENPVGQRITDDRVPDSTSTWYTIVGVAANEHMASVAISPKIEMIHPEPQTSTPSMVLVARTEGDPVSLVPAIRRIVRELDPALALSNVQPMQVVYEDSLARERFLTVLLLVFAAVGLALAIVGVYGVLSQLARTRRREMGIRIALGAPARGVRWLVVRHGLRLVLAGLVIGTGAAMIATRGLAALLFHVAPADPFTFIAVPIVLTITGVVAAWVPALQASRADPVIALRAD
jgi:putative ABC transport system permease protein